MRLGWTLVPLLALIACGGTPPVTNQGPAAPTNVAATPEPEAITVSWDHDGTNVTGFVVDRQVVAAAAAVSGAPAGVERLAIVGGIGSDARSFRDTGVEQGVGYRYAVAAIGTGGFVSASTTQGGAAVQPQPAVARMCDDPTDEPIVDAVLAAGIRDALGIQSGPTCSDLEDLTWFNFSWPDGDPVTSLEGLEHAPYLQDLGLDGNAVVSLEPLAGLGALRYLWIGGNPIADTSPLASLTRLRGLSLWGSEVTSISPLAGLVHLEYLYLGGIEFADIDTLSGMTKLRVLHIQGAGVTDLDFVANHPDLVELDVSQTQIDDGSIPVLETLTHLEALGIGQTGITDVSFLDGYTNLHTLWACCLELDDITPITSLTGLRTLDVSSFALADLSFLAPFTDLVAISAWDNLITDVAVLQDKDLDYVNLGANFLTDLSPLVANPSLGEGTTVEVPYNCLDLTPGSADMTDIESLLDRGVQVIYEPQNDGC